MDGAGEPIRKCCQLSSNRLTIRFGLVKFGENRAFADLNRLKMNSLHKGYVLVRFQNQLPDGAVRPLSAYGR